MSDKHNRKANMRCFVGLHGSHVIDTKVLKDARNIEVGNVYILECDHCGKITSKNVFTVVNV